MKIRRAFLRFSISSFNYLSLGITIFSPLPPPPKTETLSIHSYPKGKPYLRIAQQGTACYTENRKLTMAAVVTTSSEADALPLTVSVEIAHQLLQEGFRYLDVRTQEEYSGGHVEGAVNIPYMLKGETGMVKNSAFLEDVSKKFTTDEKIIVGCQSGRRSLLAATELVSMNFHGVKDMAGGLIAWTQNGYVTSSL